jgi:hypothetical protein
LPASLPDNLIRLKTQITLDGQVVAHSTIAIGISAGGISAKQLNSLKTRLENTKTQLQANNVQNMPLLLQRIILGRKVVEFQMA